MYYYFLSNFPVLWKMMCFCLFFFSRVYGLCAIYSVVEIKDIQTADTGQLLMSLLILPGVLHVVQLAVAFVRNEERSKENAVISTSGSRSED